MNARETGPGCLLNTCSIASNSFSGTGFGIRGLILAIQVLTRSYYGLRAVILQYAQLL